MPRKIKVYKYHEGSLHGVNRIPKEYSTQEDAVHMVRRLEAKIKKKVKRQYVITEYENKRTSTIVEVLTFN
jgi:hypothetical protein